MAMIKPSDSETVWIEYPEGKRFRASYDASADTFIAPDGTRIAAANVANWSHSEHEDYDISDDPKQQVGGKLTRDQ
ncbi:MAG: hypothetical protein ABJB01_05435 [Rudaea sp.]